MNQETPSLIKVLIVIVGLFFLFLTIAGYSFQIDCSEGCKFRENRYGLQVPKTQIACIQTNESIECGEINEEGNNIS